MLRAVVVGIAFIFLTIALIAALLVVGALRLPGRGGLSMAYSRTLCALLGLRIRVNGVPVSGRPVLIVANHVSWADILAITATMPAIFVAKREVSRWPLIGWVARVRGTVFVDRQRRRQSVEANTDIAQRLAEGTAVVLFGEGTSSDGNRVLPFRTSLLGAVDDALERIHFGEMSVQPLSISYTRLHGLPMGRQHRPMAAWYGDAGLILHVASFVRRGPIDVTLSWGEPIAHDGQTHRKALARALESKVRAMTVEALRGRADGA